MVRSPKRWTGSWRSRPSTIRSFHRSPIQALASFLLRRNSRPIAFSDLSLSSSKLLGPGEYVVEFRKRRRPATSVLPSKITLTQRLPTGGSGSHHPAHPEGSPGRVSHAYSRDELVDLARHCTEKENDANKVERLGCQIAAAMLLSSRSETSLTPCARVLPTKHMGSRLSSTIEVGYSTGMKASTWETDQGAAHPHRCGKGVYRFQEITRCLPAGRPSRPRFSGFSLVRDESRFNVRAETARG